LLALPSLNIYNYSMGFGVRKGMLYNLLGLGISGIAIFLFNILAGRLLGPEKYGVVAVFYSSLVTVQTLIGGGFRDVVVKYISHHEEEKPRLEGILYSVLLISLLFFVIFLLIFLILREVITTKLFEGKNLYFLFFLFASFLIPLFWILNSFFEGIRKFNVSALNLVIFHSFFPLMFLVFYIAHFPQPAGTLLGISLAPIFPLFYLFFKLNKEGIHPFKVRKKEWLNAIFKASIVLTLANFFDIFIFRSPPILAKLTCKNSAQTAGFIGAFLSILSIVRTTSIALFSSLLPNLNRAIQGNNIPLAKRYIRNSYIFIGSLGLLVVIFFGLTGPWVLKLFYGTKYIMGQRVTIFFSLFLVFYLLARLSNRILVSMTSYRWLIISPAISIIVLVCSFTILNLPPVDKVGVSVAMATFVYFLITFLKVFFTQKSL